MKLLYNKKVRIISITFICISLVLICAFFVWSYFSMNINLIGRDKITLNYSEKYNEPGYKASVLWMDATKDVDVISNLKADIGTYEILYSYKFTCFNFIKKRVIKVIDKEKPVITLKEGDLIQIYENDEFKDPGFEAKDNRDGNLTSKVKVEGQVDNKKIGEYILKYSVSDSSKNKTDVQRKVKVIKDDRVKTTQFNYNNYGGDANFVIVGDSNIKNMYLNGYLPREKAWAIPCLHAQSMQTTPVYIYGTSRQMTVIDATREYKPENMVLYFGAFSTAWITEEEFDSGATNMIKMIKEASPNTRIYLLSILPITQYGPNINNFSQSRLDYFNTKIEGLAASNGLKYLNGQSVIKDASGYGNPAYYVDDGYHLNATGHNILRNYINGNL